MTTTQPKSFQSIWSDMTTVAFTQGYLNAGGIRTRYISSGSPDKPLLLLLHGVGGHAEAYARNFQSHGEHFWTVAVDMLGHGWTEKPNVDYEIPHYAAHLLDVVKALGHTSALFSGEIAGRVGCELHGGSSSAGGEAPGVEHRRRLDGAPGSDGAFEAAFQPGGAEPDTGIHPRPARIPDVRQERRA